MIEYKHIIWDWNGTLLNDAWLCVDILNQMLKKYKLPCVNLKLYQEHFDFPVKDYYRKLGFDFSSSHSFDHLANQYITTYNKRRFECNLHSKALQIVEYIANKGIYQSILSAYPQDDLKEIIDYFKINVFFTNIIGLDNYYAESKIEIGKKLINGMNTDPDQILLIGDTIHDFKVAKAMNIGCILFSGGHQRRERLVICGVPVFNSLKNIEQLIENQIIAI
jgi:phosphoglycolate phosphatase